MRISLNWLRDYLEIKPEIDVSQISNSLTLAGLEVEAVYDLREKSALFFLGTISRIIDAEDKTCLYELNFNEEKIVAQGPSFNASVGMSVAFARDQRDNFVLMTFADLGFSTSEVISFEADFFPEGVPEQLSSVKDFDDVIFTLGITPNRADALNHLGVSRELSAILDANARVPMLTPKEMSGPTHEKVVIEIDNADDCPRYACRVVENVTVTESPFWLRLRLQSVGIRPINNVVDVTNYVMMARGQPMHAFDFDKLSKDNARAKIIVRRAHAGEKLLSLDDKTIDLCVEDLIIADNQDPIALAGVIGGKTSAVEHSTSTVLLESAYFAPTNVRMSARRHGIITESSYRFERGADPNGVVDALNYAARLLTEISSGKVCREAIDTYRKRIDPKEVKLRPERAQSVLGIDAEDFDQDVLRRKFSRLGIETIGKRGDAIYFRVPTHRFDLAREIDLIEEAARMIGYDKVKESPIGGNRSSCEFGDARLSVAVKRMTESLAARGFCEAINYAFLNNEWQSHFVKVDDSDVINIKNPLSERYNVMRMTLIPGLVRNLLHNQRNQEKSIQLFEVGTVFLGKREQGERPLPSSLFGRLDQDSFALEKIKLSGIMAGRTSYAAFDHQERMYDFYHAKGIVSELLEVLGFKVQPPFANVIFEHGALPPYLHPGECVTIKYCGDEQRVLGTLGKLHPAVAASLDITKDAFVFELDLEELGDIVSQFTKFKPFSRFPTIERDVAFLVDESVRVADILDAAAMVDSQKDTLISIRVFDIYRGKNIETGKKSVAVSLALQKSDRTLTDEEAEAFVQDYIHLLENKIGAKRRA